MDLRQLEYLVAVADSGGFTAGAAVAHVAQPSLSARIRDLERELGVDLFHRVGRGARLSSAGEVVVDHARLVLRDVVALRAAAADVAGLEGGTLDVAALPTLAVDPLADLVGRFIAAHPRVVVRVVEADDARGGGGVAELVRGGRAEVGLAELPAPVTGLVELALADQELMAIAEPAFLQAQSIPIRRENPAARSDAGTGIVGVVDLGSLPLVLTPPGTSSRRVVETALAAVGLEPVVSVEVAQREAIVPLVLAGAGIGFVPGAQAEAARAQGAAVVRLEPPLVRPIGLLHRPGRLSPAARALLEVAARPMSSARASPPRSDSGRQGRR